MKDSLRTLRTAAIWIGLAAGAWLLWYVRVAVILACGAVLAALLLHLLARLLCTKLPVRFGWALTIVTVTLFVAFAGCLWLFGSSLMSQFGDVMHKIQAGQRNLGILRQFVHGPSSLIGGMVPHALSSGLAIAEYAIIIAISGIYLAAQPELYAHGVALLFPVKLRPAAAEALEKIGATLTYWLIGQMITMAIVGVLAYILMIALRLPNPGALALIAGLSEAVPYLGPFLGAVPAVFVALAAGFAKAIWTIAGYIGIHVVEGYLLVPLLQRRLVHIPPALILLSILVSQLLFGVVGIVFAAPIAVVAFTAINLLYVRNVLDEEVNLPEDIPVT